MTVIQIDGAGSYVSIEIEKLLIMSYKRKALWPEKFVCNFQSERHILSDMKALAVILAVAVLAQVRSFP